MGSLKIVTALLLLWAAGALGLTPEESSLIDRAIKSEAVPPWEDVLALRDIGPGAVEPIVQRYADADDKVRKRLAWLLWRLRFKHEEATRLLLADARTENRDLRLTVQYALGSVSDDRVVVETLLDNMRNDDNPLFRDKAACALANDQVHLDGHQKYYLYRGLIDGLSDEKYQVRKISIKALKIHTGQKMGYEPKGGPENRLESIARWNEWLKEYQQSL